MRLVFFDVNKTCVIEDRAGGKSARDVLCETVAEHTYGVGSHDTNGAPCFMPTFVEPMSADAVRASGHIGLITYKEWVDSLFPYPAHLAGVMFSAEDAALCVERKLARRKLMAQFGTAATGTAECARAIDDLASRLVDPATGLKYYFPTSFLRGLLWLAAQPERFSLVFRTFGDDIDNVVHELATFCRGADPRFPDVRLDGSGERGLDLRVRAPAALGRLVVSGFELGDTSLVWGTAAKIEPGTLETFLAAPEHASLRVARGFDAVVASMVESARTLGTLAIGDCYAWWAACGEQSAAAKLVAIEPDAAAADVAVVFFDDNISPPESETNIVNVRNARTGAIIPLREVYGREVVPVDPYLVVLDDSYYERLLEARFGSGAVPH